MSIRIITSTCTECLVQCGSLIHMDGDAVLKITGNPDHPASQGAFCVKGANAPLANRNSPMRITHPLRRVGARGEGKWERISWDEALEGIALRLGEVKARHGGTAIAGASATFSQSRGTAMRLLLRCLGSPNYMINQDMCHGGRATAAVLTGFGGAPGGELAHARVILVVGKSPSESDVIEWKHIKEAKAAGAKLIVIDPRNTKIARLADLWLTPKTGTDVALALSLAHVMFSEDLINHDFVEQWCSGTEALRARAAEYPPERAADITGVPATAIAEAARIFATGGPASMVLGHGIDAHAGGVDTAMAFQALLGLTGNIDRPGSNRAAKQIPGYRGGFAYFSSGVEFQLPLELDQKILGGERFPLWTGADTYSHTCHNPAVFDAIETGLPYPVRAMLISGTNLVCTYPDQERTVAALKKLDLLVVAADQMTPTAELADFFLPKTTLLEEEELLSSQSQPCLQLTQRVFAPLGEAKNDLEIAIALRDKLRSHGLIEYELMPWQDAAAYLDYALANTGVSLETLRDKGYVAIPYGYEEYKKAGFKTPSKKFEFSSSRRQQAGHDPLPAYQPPAYAGVTGFDLTLLTGIRSLALHHSRFHNHAWARRMKNAPELVIHPDTAARLNIGRDDWVWVQTRHKTPRALLKAKLSDEVPSHIVATGMGWWFPELSGPEHGVPLFNIGSSMAYGPEFDPICGSPSESRNTACRIARADPAEIAGLIGQIDTAPTRA